MTGNTVWVKFNVGGKHFLTTLKTLEVDPYSKLVKLATSKDVDKDEKGAIMIDRDPIPFKHLLNFLRTGKFSFEKEIKIEVILDEAIYYGLAKCKASLEELISGTSSNNAGRIYRIMLSTLEDVVKTLGELTEGWRFEQLVKTKTSDPEEYLCVISRKSDGIDKSVEIPAKFSSKKKR